MDETLTFAELRRLAAVTSIGMKAFAAVWQHAKRYVASSRRSEETLTLASCGVIPEDVLYLVTRESLC